MNYQIIGGTTGHLLGVASLGIILGPYAGCAIEADGKVIKLFIRFDCKPVNNPVAFLSVVAFKKAKQHLLRHIATHFLLHNTYCRLSPKWVKIIYHHEGLGMDTTS